MKGKFMLATVVAGVMLAGGTANAAQTSCSDLSFLNAGTKSSNLAVQATNQAVAMRFSTAKSTIIRAQAVLEAGGRPCSSGMGTVRGYMRTSLNLYWQSFDAAEDGYYARATTLAKRGTRYTMLATSLLRELNG